MDQLEPQFEKEQEKTESRSSLNPKVFLIGLPLFIVQLLLVYFVTANILLKKFEHEYMNKAENNKMEKPIVDSSDEKIENNYDEEPVEKIVEKPLKETGKFVYAINDVIVNPAKTNGQRLMLASLGFDLRNEEYIKRMESKEPLVKDIVIGVLSSKTVPQLSDAYYKDSLKVEILREMEKRVPSVKVSDVYFTKYIIQ